MDKKLFANQDFVNCLRIQIPPDEYADERIEMIKRFALEYGFQNIILLFAAEEYFVGHLKKEEFAKVWLPTLKKARDEFLKTGLTVSLNPWMEIGHVDRGRVLAPDQHFQTMVDIKGKQAELVACPLDKNWQDYYFDFMPFYVKELQPSILWIEDDFRLHNHPPLTWGGCFCPTHMAAFNQTLGKEESRAEFVDKLSAGPLNPERKVWLDLSWATLDGLAKRIGETVSSLKQDTSVGLMSSLVQNHFLEARHWKKLQKDLSPDGVLIDRIHLPVYIEGSGKDFLFTFNASSMVIRHFLGDEVLIYPEFESDPDVPYGKDNRFGQFVIKSALALGIEGMTYNIFEFIGNGANNDDGLGDMVKDIQPFLNSAKALKLLPSQLRGPIFPIDEDSCYRRVGQEGDFYSLYSKEYDWIGMVAAFGGSFGLSTEKSFKGQCIYLIGQNARNFSDEELKALFKDNFVYLDGGAALYLQERGLLALIHASSATFLPAASRYQKTEQLNGGVYRDVHNYRLAADAQAGDYVKIDYDGAVEVISSDYDERMNYIGNGMAIGEGFYVSPYVLEGKLMAQFSPYRRKMLIDNSLEKAPLAAYSDYEGVTPYLYEQQGRFVLLLNNATVSSHPDISFSLVGVKPRKISLLGPDGSWKSLPFQQQGHHYAIAAPHLYLDMAILLLE